MVAWSALGLGSSPHRHHHHHLLCSQRQQQQQQQQQQQHLLQQRLHAANGGGAGFAHSPQTLALDEYVTSMRSGKCDHQMVSGSSTEAQLPFLARPSPSQSLRCFLLRHEASCSLELWGVWLQRAACAKSQTFILIGVQSLYPACDLHARDASVAATL
ncbi:hypothetical protein ACLKA6_005873 [Drosophila palustris]